MNAVIKFFNDEQGVTSIEYALIAALIAMAIVASVTAVGKSVTALYNQVAEGFPD